MNSSMNAWVRKKKDDVKTQAGKEREKGMTFLMIISSIKTGMNDVYENMFMTSMKKKDYTQTVVSSRLAFFTTDDSSACIFI